MESNLEFNGDKIQISRDLFETVGCDDLNAENIGKPSLTYWEDVWRRFKGNKLAMVGLVMLTAIIFFSN